MRDQRDEKTTVYFITDEAYSMFEGGDQSVPLGGTGVAEYMLADQISLDPQYRVVWVFSLAQGVANLSHQRIEIRSIPQLPSRINRFGRAFRGLIEWRTAQAVFSDPGKKVVVAPPWAMHSVVWRAAIRAGARPFVRIASDKEVIPLWELGAGAGSLLRRYFGLDSPERIGRAVLATQTQEQVDLVRAFSDTETVLLGKGWPLTAAQPSYHPDGYILWVASCRPNKQPWHFVTLASEFPERQFVMVLPPFAGIRDELYYAILRAASGLNNLRVIAELRPFAEVDAMFEGAAVFVNTSLFEGYANTFLQAADHGVPILSLQVDPDQVISTQELGIVACGNFTDFKAGLVELLAEEGLRGRTFGLNNRRHIERNHNLATSVSVATSAIEALAHD